MTAANRNGCVAQLIRPKHLNSVVALILPDYWEGMQHSKHNTGVGNKDSVGHHSNRCKRQLVCRCTLLIWQELHVTTTLRKIPA